MIDRSSAPVALVTGSGRGLGRAIAAELAGRGFHVVVNCCRDRAEAETTAAEVHAAGGAADVMVADISDPAAVAQLFAAIDDRYGRLDVLVNNAGINRDGDFRSLPDEDWFSVLATNLSGPFLCSRAAVPLMEKAGAGSIVNITARTAHRPRRRGANYCAAKAGLSMLSKCMALELAPKIRVNCVAPGTTDTEEVSQRFDLNTPDGLGRMIAPIPLGRIATPAEMARLVVYIAVDATFMTGADILYDGGRNLAP